MDHTTVGKSSWRLSMLKPEFTGQFKKDYKRAVKRGCRPEKLEEVITLL